MTRIDDIVLNPHRNPLPPIRLLIGINEHSHGVVLAYDGGDGISEELWSTSWRADELGWSDKSYVDLKPGIWVWKGQLVGRRTYMDEYETDWVGEFRQATNHEVYHFQQHGTLLDE